MSFKMKIKFDNLKKNKNKNGLGDKSCIVVGILRVLTGCYKLPTHLNVNTFVNHSTCTTYFPLPNKLLINKTLITLTFQILKK